MYDVKRAVCFHQLIRYGHESRCISYGCQPSDIRRAFGLLWEGSRRLVGTMVEGKDFEALTRQYDREDAFFYCDPPYYKAKGRYEVAFHRGGYVRLRDAPRGTQGEWSLSHNDCVYIHGLYEGYRIETVKRLSNLTQRYSQGKEYAEVFISNYDTACRSRELSEQMKLSDVYGFYP